MKINLSKFSEAHEYFSPSKHPLCCILVTRILLSLSLMMMSWNNLSAIPLMFLIIFFLPFYSFYMYLAIFRDKNRVVVFKQ